MEILGRMRSDRVLRRATPLRVYNPEGGRPATHGGEFVFGAPATWGAEDAVTVTDTRRYGKAQAQAWDRLHPRLTRRAARAEHDGPLPIITGTVIRLTVEHLPSRGVPKPSRPGPGRPSGSRNRHTATRHDVGLILVTGQAHQRPAHHKKGTNPRRKG